MIYGYARVSTKEQNLSRQLVDIINFGVKENNIYKDKESGKNFERTNYKKLKKKLKEGDLLVIKSIDRLGRNYDMIIEEWSYLTKKIKCDIVVLDMTLLDTRIENNLIGKFVSDIVLQILSFVSENERNNIKTRQAEGIKIAKENGIKFGRPKLTIDDYILDIFNRYNKRELTLKNALSLTNLSHGSFYKYYNLYIKRINW